MRLVAAGLSFHSAPLALRERAAIGESEAPALLQYLVGKAGLAGAAVLSTCNRTELYVSCERDDVAGKVVEKLGRYLDPGNPDIARHLVALYDDAAVTHLCRVAAGLESMVLGEVQILGQLRRAHQIAAAAGTLDASLDAVLRGAIEAGKRVRTDTAICHGTSSLSEVAIDAAVSAAGGLRDRGVLLIGAGKMSRLAARRLGELGARVMVTSRSESARRLAAEMGAVAVDSAALLDTVGAVDVVISSTSSPVHVVSARDVAMWQGRRGGRDLCIVDLAVPRDVEPAAADIPGVHLVDVDALGARIEQTLDARRRAVPAAVAVVNESAAALRGRLRERACAAPAIAALVEHAEALRRRELEHGLARLDLDDDVAARIDHLTRSLVRKLLHDPIGHLRRNAGDPATVEAVRRLFALDPTATEESA